MVYKFLEGSSCTVACAGLIERRTPQDTGREYTNRQPGPYDDAWRWPVRPALPAHIPPDCGLFDVALAHVVDHADDAGVAVAYALRQLADRILIGPFALRCGLD